jgi:hypothetical protein
MGDVEQAAMESAIASDLPAEETNSGDVFHTYTDENGQLMEFKTPDDMNKFIKNGIMRHSQYDRSMKELSAKEKSILEERQKYEKEMQRLSEMRGKYDHLDQFFTSPKGRQVYARLQKEYSGVKPDDVVTEAKEYTDSKTNEMLEQVKEEMERSKAFREEQERQANELWVHEQLAGKYEGYDRSLVDNAMKELEELQSLPEREQILALYDIVYQAKKGNINVADVERKIAQPKPTTKGLNTVKAGVPDKPKDWGSVEEAEKDLEKAFM